MSTIDLTDYYVSRPYDFCVTGHQALR